MPRRFLAALALTGTLAGASLAAAGAAPATPAPSVAAPVTPGGAPSAPGDASAPAAPSSVPGAKPKKAKPHAAQTALPSATPSTVPAPSGAPVPLPAASPAALPSSGFVYLRDRYRRDDQGAALHAPIAQLAGLDYMLGTWQAHIYTLDTARHITRDFGRTTYVFARTMNARWLLGTDAKNTEFLYFTYDPPAGHWVYDDLKGFPSYGLSYATGNPRRLKFEAVVESALGDERRLRTSLTYKDARHFSLLDEELTPGDVYTPVVEFDFTRI